MPRFFTFAPQGALSLAALMLISGPTAAQPQVAAAEAPCSDVYDDVLRLACYDRAAGRLPPQAAAETPADVEDAVSTQPEGRPSALAAVWELEPEFRRDTFKLVPHRANYLLLGRYSDKPNTLPTSPTPGNSVTAPIALDATESKFQFSVKVKAWEGVFGRHGNLWLGYTQQSNWQVFNGVTSSPFRETNYEPEAILAFRTNASLLGWDLRMLNIGLVHQSNGRPLPLSRSWNRVYAQLGIERGNVTVLARPWLRLSEDEATDDNPDIRDFMGSGDLQVAYNRGGHVYAALGRLNGSTGRGALQLDWAFPISLSLKGYVQATTGYGESLIDYNYKQNTLGIGLLLVPWQ